jgi:hypothetical protein
MMKGGGKQKKRDGDGINQLMDRSIYRARMDYGVVVLRDGVLLVRRRCAIMSTMNAKCEMREGWKKLKMTR